MSDTFYRATLRLERVEPYTEDDSILDRGTEIAYIALTGDSPAEAMEQIYDHAETLYVWHRTKADDRAALDEGVPFTLHDLSDRLRDMFAQRDEQTARAEAKKVIDDIVATETAHGEPETPLADWERGLLAAQADHDNAVQPERPFIGCQLPDPLNPNRFCRLHIGHTTPCSFVPADQLPASADDEGDETAAKQDPGFGRGLYRPVAAEPVAAGPQSDPEEFRRLLREEMNAAQSRPGHSAA